MITKHSLIAIASFLATFLSSSAAPPKMTTHLNLVWQDGNKIQHKVVPHNKLTTADHLNVTTPHPATNSAKETGKWSGTLLRTLVKSSGATLQKGADFVVVGSDGYSVSLNSTMVQSFPVLLANRLNGNPVSLKIGGPQLIFPIHDQKLPTTFRIDSWWCWEVTGIVLGKLSPLLEIYRTGERDFSINLHKTKHQIRNAPRSYTIGMRLNPTPKGNADISYLPIEQLSKQLPRQGPIGTLEVETFLGERFALPGSPTSYELRFAWDGNDIRPSFGGPIQICRKSDTNTNDCRYFVKALWIKE